MAGTARGPLGAGGVPHAGHAAACHMLGSRATEAPIPEIEVRAGSSEFAYVDPSSAKRVIVTVEAVEVVNASFAR